MVIAFGGGVDRIVEREDIGSICRIHDKSLRRSRVGSARSPRSRHLAKPCKQHGCGKCRAPVGREEAADSSGGIDHWLEANGAWHRHLADVMRPVALYGLPGWERINQVIPMEALAHRRDESSVVAVRPLASL